MSRTGIYNVIILKYKISLVIYIGIYKEFKGKRNKRKETINRFTVLGRTIKTNLYKFGLTVFGKGCRNFLVKSLHILKNKQLLDVLRF